VLTRPSVQVHHVCKHYGSNVPLKGRFMPAAARQLNINLPENVADELEDIAKTSRLSMEDIVKSALTLVKIAADASKKNQKLVVADESGKPIAEINLKK
jgi:hypothetical protein